MMTGKNPNDVDTRKLNLESVVKLPPGRVYQLDTDLEKLFDGAEDIGIGPRYLGHVHKGHWHVEYGGPRVGYLGSRVIEIVENPEDIVDGKIEIIGPDFDEVPVESSFPYVFHFKIWGPQLSDIHTEYLERIVNTGLSFQEGLGCFGSRSETWIRINKNVLHKHNLRKFAQITRAVVMTDCPLVEAIEVRLIVGAPEIGGEEAIRPLLEESKRYWDMLDAKYGGLEDDDVDSFYGCTICQSFAPNHVCVVTPTRYAYCGIISYFGAKATYEADPLGYIFEMSKGEELDPLLGCYTGVDEAVFEKSHRVIKKVCLNSSIKYTTTNCGCFEAVSYYIPEVDGIGLVHRRYYENTPLGVPFSKIAGFITGGAQNHGFKGISVRGMTMKTFLMGDGGWDRIVWLPKDLKLEIADAIPEEVYDKLATEEDVTDPNELKEFLREKKHPIVEKFWKNGEPQPIQVPPPGADWPEE